MGLIHLRIITKSVFLQCLSQTSALGTYLSSDCDANVTLSVDISVLSDDPYVNKLCHEKLES